MDPLRRVQSLPRPPCPALNSASSHHCISYGYWARLQQRFAASSVTNSLFVTDYSPKGAPRRRSACRCRRSHLRPPHCHSLARRGRFRHHLDAAENDIRKFLEVAKRTAYGAQRRF